VVADQAEKPSLRPRVKHQECLILSRVQNSTPRLGGVADQCFTQMTGVGALERYWIRNRGRVQGPFTVDRIQGLLRRGRFSRHFHVSEDKKEWSPASDFPELFAGVGRDRGGSDDDDEVFRGGSSPFDDEDLAPTRPNRSVRKSRGDEDEDDDDLEDEDEEDEEEWDDEDDSGVLSGLLDWIEDNAKTLAAVLIVLLLGLGWFVFGRESFAQDAADLEVLLDLKTKISTAHSMGADAAGWQQLTDSTLAELKPMVDRLNETASSKDHIKQELLFASRDDIPKMFDQLPRGQTQAEQSVMLRFSRIDQMIKNEVRFSAESVLTLPPVAATSTQQQQQQPTPEPPGQAEANEFPQPPPDNTSQPQQQQGMPPNRNGNRLVPQQSMPAPAQPQNNGGGVPGRPAPAKF